MDVHAYESHVCREGAMDGMRGGWESCLACRVLQNSRDHPQHQQRISDSNLPLSKLFHGQFTSADGLNLA